MIERSQRLSRSLLISAGLIGLVAVSSLGAAEIPGSEKLAVDLPKLVADARALEHGEGVTKDPLRAVSLYCEAARLGDAEAQFSLGWMYANGRGVAHSDEMAAYFFKLAVQQGHAEAKKMLRFVGDTAAPMPDCMHDPVAEDVVLDDYQPVGPAQEKVYGIVSKLAPEYGVSPLLAMAIIRAESNFEPTAVSAKNAQGLMQLIPETSLRFNVRKPFDPEQNIRGGLSYLRWLLAYFEGKVSLVAAAYNAGEGTVNRYRGVPPYPETRDYVKRILSLVKRDDHPYDPEVTTPSPELPNIRLVKSP